MDGLPRIYTVDEVAATLGCHRSTVHRMIDAGLIRSVRVGIGRRRGHRVTEDALRAYLQGAPT